MMGVQPVTLDRHPERAEAVQPIIVGLGHAGTKFHLAPMKAQADALFGSDGIELLEPMLIDPKLADGSRFEDLPAAMRPMAVVHIATPAVLTAQILEKAHRLGYRRFLVEKPMCMSLEQADRIEAVARQNNAKIVVATNWLFSRLTEHLEGEVARRGGPATIAAFQMHQHKPRFTGTLKRSLNPSVFEIEIPHMLSLASHLMGGDLSLRSCRADDMVVEGRRFDALGAGELHAVSPHGGTVALYSDMRRPVRERWVEITFRNGERIRGYYPCSSDDHYAQLMAVTPEGDMTVLALLEDNTVSTMFTAAYRYFAGAGPRPKSAPEFHLPLCRMLATARAQCGIATPHTEALS